MATPDAPTSTLDDALRRVGDRWTLLIVNALLDGPARFADLLEAVSPIAPNILSARLKHLENEGLVVAQPYSRRPPRMTYELTATGHELTGVIRLLAHWAAGREGADPPRHDACGTSLDVRWYCPTCSVGTDADEVDLRVV